ncbi:MAG: F0F1 ATP synthase subunit alpha [Candidatus Omnitrophota bacterium]
MTLQYKEFGTVKAIRGCIITVLGLENCINGQLIRFGFGTEGTIMGFDEKETQVLVIKETEPVKTGDSAIMTLEPFNTPVGDKFVGRIINVLGEPMDGLGPLPPDAYYPIFADAPPILDREIIKETLETGIKILDTMIPIGKGQRELILGDKMTGKTTIGTDIILNQKGKNVICIYCAIGKSRAALNRVINTLKRGEAFEYTTIIAAQAGSAPGQLYLAPYVSCSLGEYFMKKGRDVVVIFDDFTKHAWSYREISLLLGRPPGRESYPGDIFYLHSRMIERAAKMTKKYGGGSMTFLPIVELLEGDLTAYVSSNLVSMTDGQIYLSSSLFGEGFKPAINVGLSVSRIGTKVQWPALKKFTKVLRLQYVQYEELMRVSKLKASGSSESSGEQMKEGQVLSEFLKQDKDDPVTTEAEVLLFAAHTKKLVDDLEAAELVRFKREAYPYAFKKNPDLFIKMRQTRNIDDEAEQMIVEMVNEFVQVLISQRPKEEVEEEYDGKDATIGAASQAK